jgi:hypothetical protein
MKQQLSLEQVIKRRLRRIEDEKVFEVARKDFFARHISTWEIANGDTDILDARMHRHLQSKINYSAYCRHGKVKKIKPTKPTNIVFDSDRTITFLNLLDTFNIVNKL